MLNFCSLLTRTGLTQDGFQREMETVDQWYFLSVRASNSRRTWFGRLFIGSFCSLSRSYLLHEIMQIFHHIYHCERPLRSRDLARRCASFYLVPLLFLVSASIRHCHYSGRATSTPSSLPASVTAQTSLTPRSMLVEIPRKKKDQSKKIPFQKIRSVQI